MFPFALQVVALSDLFTERQQYEWMLEALLEVQKTHPSEDELVNQYLAVGVCKAAAVVGMVSHTGLTPFFHSLELLILICFSVCYHRGFSLM